MIHSNSAVGPNKPHIEISYHDDPVVVEEQLREEYTNHVVPPTARLNKWTVFGGWSSIASAMAFVYFGVLSASIAGIQQAFIGIILTVAVYSIIGSKAAKEALRWGMNSTLLSRDLFGFKGAALAPLLIAIAAIYYAVLESSIIAVALQSYFGGWDIRFWYVVVIVGMLPLMLGSLQTWLGKLNSILLPIYFFGLILAVIVAGYRFGWEGDWAAFKTPESVSALPGWISVFVLYMGVWLLFPDTQDMARFAREADSTFHRRVTFGWVFYCLAYLFNGLIGVLIYALAEKGAGTEAGVVQGIIKSIGGVGLVVIIASQVRINSANLYFASISMERFIAHLSRKNLPRQTWVALLLLLVLGLMFTNPLGFIYLSLSWLGVLFVSWVGIMMVHWILDGRRQPEIRPSRLYAVAPGFFAWLFAALLGGFLIQAPGQFPTLSAIAPIISLTVSMLLYWLMRAIGWSARRPPRFDLVRSEVKELWSTRIKCGVCERSYVAFEVDTSRADTCVLCLNCQLRD